MFVLRVCFVRAVSLFLPSSGAMEVIPPLEQSGQDEGVPIDCKNVCAEQMSRISNLYLQRNSNESRASLVVWCRELRRLRKCLDSLDSLGKLSGNNDPIRRNCDLNVQYITHFQWTERVLKDECTGVTDTVPGELAEGACRVEGRRPVKDECVRKNLTVCQLFGDRHLLRADGVLETCLLRGAWPMLQLGDYLHVWASNVQKLPGCTTSNCAKETTDLQEVSGVL